MTQKISPFLEGKYGWDFGESGWNSGMDENLLKFSFLFDRNVDSIVSTLPTAVDGQAHYNTTDNRLYFAVGTTYYSTPVPKWFVITVRNTGAMWQFNGTSLVQLEGTQNLDTRLDSVELTISTLGTAAYEDTEFFATQSSLDVATAQASSYTDNVIGKKGIVSVRDYITTPVDGTTSNQLGIVAAVAAAYAAGAELRWPAGTYVSDADIPNFHAVRHVGEGVVSRGGEFFSVCPRAGNTNRIYCSPTGSQDGLGVSTPANFSSIVNILKNYGPELIGAWRVVLSSGEHIAPVEFSGLTSTEYLTIQGPVSGNENWTATIHASGATTLYFRGALRVHLLDVDISNESGSWSAVALDGGAYLWIRDCLVRDAKFAGINSNIGTRVVVDGCIIQDITNGPAVLIYNATGATGYNGRRTTIRRCHQGVSVQSGYGHIDYTDFIDGAYGLMLSWEAHSSNYHNTFTNVNVAVETLGHCSVNTGDCTYTNVGTKQRDSLPGGDEYNADISIGEGYSKTRQVYRHLGNAGREANGYKSWILPTTPYQYCNGTVSGIPLSGMGPCVSLWESGGNTILGVVSPDASYGGIWFGNSASPRHCEIRALSGQLSTLFSGNLGYTLSAVRIAPGTDGDKQLGSPTARWSTIYSSTGTINTSDERSKQQIKPVDDAALRAWSRVEYVQYKFNDAVEQKGDGARWHFGLIAQRVKEAFEAEGLSAFEYGLLCYDEWDETMAVEEQRDDEGNVVVDAEPYRPAGDRYGIRYEEALALECAYLRSLMGK